MLQQQLRTNNRGEAYVIGPTGAPLTIRDLPPPNTGRWVIRRKAEVVAAVRGGLISLEDALARYPDLHPVAVGVFGGVIDPTHLRFPFSRMAACDARDWQQIHRWAAELEPALAAARAVAS